MVLRSGGTALRRWGTPFEVGGGGRTRGEGAALRPSDLAGYGLYAVLPLGAPGLGRALDGVPAAAGVYALCGPGEGGEAILYLGSGAGPVGLRERIRRQVQDPGVVAVDVWLYARVAAARERHHVRWRSLGAGPKAAFQAQLLWQRLLRRYRDEHGALPPGHHAPLRG